MIAGSIRRAFCAGWLCACLCALTAAAQDRSPLPPPLTGPELVGSQAATLPGLNQALAQPAAPQAEQVRESTERYPVNPTPILSITNEFGPVMVRAWEERVVEVRAQIRVRAANDALAAAVAGSIRVQAGHADDQVRIETVLPERREDAGFISMEVGYSIMVPRGASVTVRNVFGDTTVQGVSGAVTVDAQYGGVDLSDLALSARVTSHGEFPVKAQRLAQGGVFDLYGATGEFAQVDGPLRVHGFRGAVTLRAPGSRCQADVTVDSAPLQVFLPPNADPNFDAVVLYGEFASILPVQQTVQGGRLTARHSAPGTQQQLTLSAVFGNISIQRENLPETPGQPAATPDKSFTDTVQQAEKMPAGSRLLIDAAPGDIRIEPSESGQLEWTATRVAWAESASQAPAVLQQMTARIQHEDGALRLITSLGASEDAARRKINLMVRCPKTLEIELQAAQGTTTLTGLAGKITVHQLSGPVAAMQTEGPVVIVAENGGASATQCSGTVEMTVHHGDVQLKAVRGAMRVNVEQGRTAIEGPLGPVEARSKGGDIRILALEGLANPCSAWTENGHISMLLGPESDVSLALKATNGMIRSSVPVQGSLTRDVQEFRGRLRDGQFLVQLETKNGDIALD